MSCVVVSEICFQSITVTITVFFHSQFLYHMLMEHTFCVESFKALLLHKYRDAHTILTANTEVCSQNIATKLAQDGTECATEHVEGSGIVGIIQCNR